MREDEIVLGQQPFYELAKVVAFVVRELERDLARESPQHAGVAFPSGQVDAMDFAKDAVGWPMAEFGSVLAEAGKGQFEPLRETLAKVVNAKAIATNDWIGIPRGEDKDFLHGRQRMRPQKSEMSASTESG